MGLRLGLHAAVHEACLGVGTGEIKWAGSGDYTPVHAGPQGKSHKGFH